MNFDNLGTRLQFDAWVSSVANFQQRMYRRRLSVCIQPPGTIGAGFSNYAVNVLAKLRLKDEFFHCYSINLPTLYAIVDRYDSLLSTLHDNHEDLTLKLSWYLSTVKYEKLTSVVRSKDETCGIPTSHLFCSEFTPSQLSLTVMSDINIVNYSRHIWVLINYESIQFIPKRLIVYKISISLHFHIPKYFFWSIQVTQQAITDIYFAKVMITRAVV